MGSSFILHRKNKARQPSVHNGLQGFFFFLAQWQNASRARNMSASRFRRVSFEKKRDYGQSSQNVFMQWEGIHQGCTGICAL